jgi:AraC-like DNA-binding protein
MSVLVRAADVPMASRADYLREAVRAAVGTLDIRMGDGQHLPDQVRVTELGAIRVGELSASQPGGADRIRRHVRLMDADMCKVDVVAQGEVVLEQTGREARLHVGDYAFVDLSRPAHWTNSWSTQVVSIAFPRQLLPLSTQDLSELTGIGLTPDGAPSALFSSTARQLARDVDGFDSVSGVRVGAATLDLLTVALAWRLDRSSALPSDISERALGMRMRAFIEDRLADPDLTPATVARAHHVSLRYMYKLFEAERASVAGLIKERRLERCRRDLGDPAFADVPVSEIAARWGLMNAAHFSRTFRVAYGASPVEYRRLAHGGRPAQAVSP